jgi:beta-aspartyl-peptidase (threonine type)
VSGVRAAAETGAEALGAGESALDAAIAAVAVLEDDPTFNAGTGSSLTLDGGVEMDAGIMDGVHRTTGAVAMLQGVRHPVRVARAVMDRTDHCLLGGEGARRFARALGFAEHDPVTEAARRRWRRHRRQLDGDGLSGLPWLGGLLADHPELGGDTVGAVAVDGAGRLAAAASTGGVMLKLPGRIGDTPLAGAGFHADRTCAVAATGRGELMVRYGTCRSVADRIAAGDTPQQAVAAELGYLREHAANEVGLIAVDLTGQVGLGHLTPAMPHALASGDAGSVTARLHHG